VLQYHNKLSMHPSSHFRFSCSHFTCSHRRTQTTVHIMHVVWWRSN